MIPISVIIPTYNRNTLLNKIIYKYLLDEPKEIIIVDDYSNIPFKLEYNYLNVKTKIIVIRNKERIQQPACRMKGLEYTTEEFVFFGEDDAYPDENYLKSLYEIVSEGILDIACGNLFGTKFLPENNQFNENKYKRVIDLSKEINWISISLRWDIISEKINYLPFLHTLSLMKKSTVLDVGGFDKNFVGNAFREETDFYIRALNKNYKLGLVPNIKAFHYGGKLKYKGGQHSFSLLNYEKYVFKNNLRFLRKNKDAFKKINRKKYPFFSTMIMMLYRTRGYPGRIKASIKNKGMV